MKQRYKALIGVGCLMMLFAGNVQNVSAKEDRGNYATGQTEVVYIPDERPPVEELDKGDGQLSPSPNTGEQTKLTACLDLLVIASAGTLMLIIYIKKGEADYEEN